MLKRKSNFSLIVIILSSALFSINAQSLTKGPYLANPSNSLITIRWESDIKDNFIVKYGETDSFEHSVAAELISELNNMFLYEANLNGLTPGEKYNYQVTSKSINSDTASFKVGLKESEQLSFVVVGDSRSKPHIFGAIANQINQINPAVIIANGDLVAKGGNLKHWQTQFFDASKLMINHIPFISSVGDHESDEVDGDEGKLFTHFLFPEMNNEELWFSYDFGDAHFTFLDWRHPNNKEMIEWFKKDIANSDKPWKFVVMHRPTYNLGGHRTAWGKNIWPKLFSESKIDIVFAGHSHLYERFYPLKPSSDLDAWAVTYITTGGAGASLYEAIQHPSLAYTKSINHFMKVELSGNQIEIKAVGINGSVLDSVGWRKNNGIISEEYLATSKPQEELDIINVFNGPISKRMERLPMVEVPYAPVLKLNSTKINEDIRFTIRLAEESVGKYKMDPFSGILKSESELDIQLKVFAKSTMTVTKWGEVTPHLRLIAEYKTETFEGKVIGKMLEYIAW